MNQDTGLFESQKVSWPHFGVIGHGAGLCARRLGELLDGRVEVYADRAAVPVAEKLWGLLVLSLTGAAWEADLANRLAPGAALILDLDQVGDFPYPLVTGGPLITCGLDSRATLTASSLQEEGGRLLVQCCLQRNLLGRSGLWEPQEFGILAPAAEDVSVLLLAVAAALLC